MPNTIEPDQVIELQRRLGLRDTEIARALGVTRQTWRNWRLGRTIPYFVGYGLRAIDELHRLDPANENLPAAIRKTTGYERYSGTKPRVLLLPNAWKALGFSPRSRARTPKVSNGVLLLFNVL